MTVLANCCVSALDADILVTFSSADGSSAEFSGLFVALSLTRTSARRRETWIHRTTSSCSKMSPKTSHRVLKSFSRSRLAE